MIKTDNKGNVVACITTKEDLDYTNFDKETINYYEGFLIPSYEELSDKQNKEIERLKSIIKEVREHIEKTIEYEKGCGFNRWTYEDGQQTYIDMVEKTLDILDKGE